MKHVRRILSILALLGILAACAPGPLVPMTHLTALNNDLKSGQRIQPITVGGLQFNHVCKTSYNTTMWRVTASKTIECALEVVEAPEGTKIQVVHIHVDTSLIATKYEVDGLTVDSMDDKLESGTLPGVMISAKHPYRLIFSVEGFSKDLIDGWMFVSGDYGSGEITQRRLTEENLISYGGVYGQKFSYIYKLLVADPGEDFHVETFQDEFYIPVGAQPTPAPSATPSGQ